MPRRMFSPDIVESDAFLDMPATSQSLYFHLGMYADDDGFVNPKKIMRLSNSSDDDLKVLVGKRFVLPFENGVVVIKHWRINNLIRKDWYKETVYLEQKKQLRLKKNGSYTECQQFVNSSLTKPPRRLGKVRLGKDSIGKDMLQATACDYGKEINLLIGEFEKVNPTLNYGNKTQRQALEDLIKKFGYDKTLSTVKFAVSVQGQRFAPVITTPYQLKVKLGELKIFYEREENNKPKTIIL